MDTFIVKSWLGHLTARLTDYYSRLPFDMMETAAAKPEEKSA
jgi:hypothetical protein